MAKKYYYRRRRRRVRWSKQLKNVTNSTFNAAPNSSFYLNYQLITNPVESSSTVPTPRYFKRVKLSFEIEGPNISYIEGLTAHIVYAPEDIAITAETINKHPEWVLGSRFYGSIKNTDEATKVFTLYSKLCKKLLSGDSIVVLFTGTNTNQTTTFSGSINFFIQYFSR